MPNRVRYREDRQIDIPDFEPGFSFNARRARYDKIEISVDLGTTRYRDIGRAHRAFEQIAKNSSLLLNNGTDNFPGLKIRKRNEGWLFGGEVKIISTYGQDSHRIRANLALNVTRFFAHNPPARPRRGRYYSLRNYVPTVLQTGREGFYNQDNLITDARLEEALQTDWNDLLKAAVDDATHAIIDEITRLDHNNTFVFEGVTNWSIRSCEIYWEYRTKNAAVIAESFGHHAASEFRSHRKRIHLSEINYNASYVTYIYSTKRKEVNIALYAKTPNRLRIECRFLTYPKSIYPDLSCFHSTEMDSLYEMMPMLVRKAQAMVKPMIEAKESYKTRRFLNRISLISDLAGLAKMAGDNQVILNKIISSLIISGRVCETSDKRYNKVLTDLVFRELLKPYQKLPRQPRSFAPTGTLGKIIKLLNKECA